MSDWTSKFWQNWYYLLFPSHKKGIWGEIWQRKVFSILVEGWNDFLLLNVKYFWVHKCKSKNGEVNGDLNDDENLIEESSYFSCCWWWWLSSVGNDEALLSFVKTFSNQWKCPHKQKPLETELKDTTWMIMRPNEGNSRK